MTTKPAIRKASHNPGFRSKRRPCGKCGREFDTTVKRRYHCRVCRLAIHRSDQPDEELC